MTHNGEVFSVVLGQISPSTDVEPVGTAVIFSVMWIVWTSWRQFRARSGTSKLDPMPGPAQLAGNGGGAALGQIARSWINALHLAIVLSFDSLVLVLAGVSPATMYVCGFVVAMFYVFPVYQSVAVRVGLMDEEWPL